MDKKQIIAIIGAILLFFGVFAPIVSVPILGSLNYFHNGEGDGVIVLALAAATIALVFARLYKGLWLTGGGSLAVLAFTFINFQSKMSEVRTSMAKDLAGNPFAGLGEAALSSVQLQWGWAVLVIGACLVIAAALVREDSTVAEVQGTKTENRKCPICAEIIRAEAKMCRFCKSELTPLHSSSSTPESPETVKYSKALRIGLGIVAAFVVLMTIGVIADRSSDQSLTWTDPRTGLMWTKQDNGSNVDLNQASNYCQNLTLGGYSNWRLPTIDELAGIDDQPQSVNSLQNKGNIQLSSWWIWSTTASGIAEGDVLYFDFVNRKGFPDHLVGSNYERALCVRRPRQ
jgi:hypothetical protein